MRFRKKPVVIDATEWRGDNQFLVMRWVEEVNRGSGVRWEFDGPILKIPTLEGVMEARPGDWIIRGVKGEFYPCKPDIFAATYEPVEDPR